jgi:hypothetical protein
MAVAFAQNISTKRMRHKISHNKHGVIFPLNIIGLEYLAGTGTLVA